MLGISGIINSIVQLQSSTPEYLVDTTSTFSICAMHSSRTSSLCIISINHHNYRFASQSYLQTRLTRQTPLKLHQSAANLISYARLALVMVHRRCGRSVASGVVSCGC
jgi:hypothetical protein